MGWSSKGGLTLRRGGTETTPGGMGRAVTVRGEGLGEPGCHWKTKVVGLHPESLQSLSFLLGALGSHRGLQSRAVVGPRVF